ncbi:sigma-54-dependent transcriptional regulator [Alkalicella caledoniensis]|uniref:Sigma-54-dependent transcriptional regulator n=1 Tax=Alkalicella caledoniensis TaxID=2731377 RepID=A0A7G9WBW3_ALKCA|nr:sigma-54-dependent Fis family transcriptional regulator [Alkalicella caledoniensis]QNO16175.1 sigma-54-dependent transcriptional regulator [Alkalicella caledoniensis]
MGKRVLGLHEIQVILDSIYDAIMAVDLQGKIILMNKGAEKIVGVPYEQCLGKDVVEMVPSTRLPRVLAEKKPELNKKQMVGDISIVTNRMPVFNQRGQLVGAVAVFRDITEVKQLAEKVTNLREVQVTLESIINSTEDAISVVDQDGKGIMINPAYKKLTGFTENDIIGKPASVDISEGESVHEKVLQTKQPVKSVKMKVGPLNKEVLVDAAPLIVDDKLKGSVAVIHDISELKRLNEELDKAKRIIRKLEAKYTFEDIIAEEPNMKMAIEQAKNAAVTPATVLLRGESGTGKELFAHAIHNSSNRKYNQFIRVNCAAISENLLESELFGYVDGAFTGAKRGGKKGLFAQASGGTIFLDEIGEISLNLQAKLLRVLQEREIVPVGDTKSQNVDARVIAATNVNLEEAIKEGKFREDLYFRISVVPIFIPPLRKRHKEIALLATHLLRKFNQEYGRSIKGISEEALRILQGYYWRGNVRELENVIGRAIINMDFSENVIGPNHLPHLGEEKQNINTPKLEISNNVPLASVLDSVEKEYIEKVLEANKYNKTKTAKDLDISIRSLYNKIEKYNLQ